MRKRHASRREKGGQVSGKRQGRNRRAHEGASRETHGIFIVLSGFATSDLSVDFYDARQGRSLWKNANGAAFHGSRFCSHVSFGVIPDSVDNRISALSEQTPLAAAERPSVASQ